jgi:hypothetical protein
MVEHEPKQINAQATGANGLEQEQMNRDEQALTRDTDKYECASLDAVFSRD